MEGAWQERLHGSWELHKQNSSTRMEDNGCAQLSSSSSSNISLYLSIPLMAFFPGFQFRKAWWGMGRNRQVRNRQWWAPTGAYQFSSFPSTCCSSFPFVPSSLFFLLILPESCIKWEQKISVEVLLSGDNVFSDCFGIYILLELLVVTFVKMACNLLCCWFYNLVWSPFEGYGCPFLAILAVNWSQLCLCMVVPQSDIYVVTHILVQ